MTHPLRPRFNALFALALLGGCAAVPDRPAELVDADAPGVETVFVAEAGQDTRQPGREPLGFDQPVLYRMLVGELAGHRGDYARAVDEYATLAAELDEPAVAERAAKIAAFAGRREEALAAASRWVTLQPESVEAHHVKAVMLMRSGDTDGALREFLGVLDASPAVASQRLRMITGFLGREDDKNAAADLMARLVEARPNDDDAWFALAVLSLRAGRNQTARDALEHLLADESAVPDDTIAGTYISVLQQLGDVDTAEQWLEGRVRRHPESVELRTLYARLLADLQRFPESRKQFELLARRAPDNTEVRFALGLLYLQEGRLDQAQSTFERLAQGEERRNEALMYLGQLAEQKGEPARALEMYRKVEDPAARFDAGLRSAVLLANQKDVAAARALLQSLPVESVAQRDQLQRFEAELLAEAGELVEAMTVYDAALADDRYDTDLLYGRAMLAERLGRLDVLERDLRRIIEREPGNAQALNALGYTLADRTDRLQEAEGYIRRALEASPNDFYILDSMGWVLHRLGRSQEGLEYLRRAQALRPDPEVAAHIAEVLWSLGRRDEARGVWEEALRNSPENPIILKTLHRLGVNP
jgi:tetratricopeptide (TPR) repeat protein